MIHETCAIRTYAWPSSRGQEFSGMIGHERVELEQPRSFNPIGDIDGPDNHRQTGVVSFFEKFPACQQAVQ